MTTTRSPLDQALRLPGVWRARDVALAEAPGVPTGWHDLDGRLPGGGWPRGALTELHVPALGVGELSLLAPALAQLSQEARWLAFVDPPELPYAPALAQRGIALERVLVLRTRNARDARWSVEQLVRSGTASAVLAWLPDGDERVLRRVHAAAAGGPTLIGPVSDHSVAPPATCARPLGAPPTAIKLTGAASGPMTSAIRSPPNPHLGGSSTVSAKAAATTASKALPPSRMTSAPAWAASGDAAQTTAREPRAVTCSAITST